MEFAYMSERQYTRKMNEKLGEDNCMNVAEIFCKKNETYVNLMIREQTMNHWTNLYQGLRNEEIVVPYYARNSI